MLKQQNAKLEPIGRVLSVVGRRGTAEFVPTVKVGDYIYYRVDKKKVLCQVSYMNTQPLKGLNGKFDIVDFTAPLPKTWENLYAAQVSTGGQIEMGVSGNSPVKFRLNPFFKHILVGGKTGYGKTHSQILIQEQLAKLEVPSLLIDTQGEFICMPQISDKAVVVEEIRIEDLLGYLKEHKTVILNLQGLSTKSKTSHVSEILSDLFSEKEKDYKIAENDKRLLQIPPVIVDIDETEIYAPENKAATKDKECKDTINNLVKRGGKIGIGVIVNSQRLPALHYDVRSQCGSAIIFRITDGGSRQVLSEMPYITALDLKLIKSLPAGTCLVTGEIVEYPLVVKVHDIKTPRAKDLDFESQLGIPPVKIIELQEEEPLIIQDLGRAGITYAKLKEQYPARQIKGYPQMETCLVIPEHHFKPDWRQTLELQGNKVLHCPDMPGGGVYLIAEPKKKRARDTWTKPAGPCSKCGLPKDKCVCP